MFFSPKFQTGSETNSGSYLIFQVDKATGA